MLFVVKYTGPWGFLKPWTAARDEYIVSQKFLTPSIIEGIRIYLGVEAIVRHRLQWSGIDRQTETTEPRGYYRRWNKLGHKSILKRGVLVNPVLFLAFSNKKDAQKALHQHVSLCRNEDMLFPTDHPIVMSEQAFDKIPGAELLFGKHITPNHPQAIMVGYHHFADLQPMWGVLVRVKEAASTPP